VLHIGDEATFLSEVAFVEARLVGALSFVFGVFGVLGVVLISLTNLSHVHGTIERATSSSTAGPLVLNAFPVIALQIAFSALAMKWVVQHEEAASWMLCVHSPFRLAMSRSIKST
jgi:hypothetical protein